MRPGVAARPAPASTGTARDDRGPGTLARETLALIAIFLIVLAVARPSLLNADIDDLDSAHHLLDGYFFRDLIVDHPHAHLSRYVFDYYKQYPALGFVFWPPLFPLVLGLFCLAGGSHVLTARVCMLCFGMLFAASFYAILRRRFSAWLSFSAVTASVAVPGAAWSFNQVMLELPTLAVMCLAVLAYLNLTDHLEEPTDPRRALVCALALAAVVYTKQPAWFLYAALAFDFLLVHRRFIRKAEIGIVLGATAIFCLPLLLFTLKFGHANLAQSVGNNTRLIMHQYDAIPRWSLAAWAYYPRLAPSLLGPSVFLLGCGGLVLALLRRDLLRANALWIGWFFAAYLTFSFYDNRLPRHATFWWPAWIALAAACTASLMQRMPSRWAALLPVVLLLPVPFQVARSWRNDYTDFRQVQTAVAGIFAQGDPGNILLFGPDKQVLVAVIREHDPHRAAHVIRGERLLGPGRSVAAICRLYRVRTVLFALPPGEIPDSAIGPLRPLVQERMLHRGREVLLVAMRYDGPIDPAMADIPLSGDLL